MAAGLAFGGFDTCRDFGLVDIVVFLAVGTGDFHHVTRNTQPGTMTGDQSSAAESHYVRHLPEIV